RLDVGDFPENLSELRQSSKKNWDGPYLPKSVPLDPWGNPYIYRVPGDNDNPFYLASLGKDGKPLAVVELAVDSGPHVEKSGEEVVNQACMACHGTGLMNSPIMGDSAAWRARIALGYEVLTKNAIDGIRTMPARGGNPDLTDNEIARAVAFMANKAGASFTPPAK
ncbi:MAG: hypothetical protein COB34_06395, partial [Methylophilaceae bacterium]